MNGIHLPSRNVILPSPHHSPSDKAVHKAFLWGAKIGWKRSYPFSDTLSSRFTNLYSQGASTRRVHPKGVVEVFAFFGSLDGPEQNKT